MPLELGVWRIDRELQRLNVTSLEQEKRLEDFLAQDISIASPYWMVIGRQVATDYGKFIDLLAIDKDGNLVVIELKKNITYRDIVGQLLDYGSWVKNLDADDISQIFQDYQVKYHPQRKELSLDTAFCEYFNLDQMPEELNENHQLVIVASSLDESTERVVNYLSEEHSVPINAIFFRIFRDGDREYLSSLWFIDPTIPSPPVKGEDKEPWNGEFYVSFGHEENGRRWEDAVKYGFICAGGGRWYSRTLNQLEVGKRVWVNIPGKGYAGVCEVLEPVVKVDEFKVQLADKEAPITEADLVGPNILKNKDNEDRAEYLVRVKWLKTVDVNKAIREKGFFGNQNTVCKPLSKKWQYTVNRLKKQFDIK